MIRFVANGTENGKTTLLVQKRCVGVRVTVASIVFDGIDWCLHHLGGRIDRFGKLSEAKAEAMKL
jgi:hypothetical protein